MYDPRIVEEMLKQATQLGLAERVAFALTLMDDAEDLGDVDFYCAAQVILTGVQEAITSVLMDLAELTTTTDDDVRD